MKKNIFLQTLIFSLIIFLTSCSHGLTDKKSKNEGDKKAYINIQLQTDMSRNAQQTLFPQSNINNLTDIVLTGKLGDTGTEQTLLEATDIAQLTGTPIALYAGSWNFTLSATLNGISFSATKEKVEVLAGTNSTVTFALEPDSSVTKGGLNIKLKFPTDITKVHLTFTDLAAGAGGTGSDYTKANGRIKEETDENSNTYNTLTVDEKLQVNPDNSITGLESGMYGLEFLFFADDLTDAINDITVYAKVSRALTTASTIDIPDFDDIYNINYKAYKTYEDQPVGLTSQAIDDLVVGGTTYTNKFTRKSTTVTFPTLTLPGYNFEGWYDKYDNKIENWTQRFDDLTLYAKWSSGTVNVDVTNPSEKVTLTVSTPDSNGIVTLTAANTIDALTYTWYIDGVEKTGVTGNTLQFDTTGKADGVYPITVECGNYSTTTNVGVGFIGVKASPDSVGDIVFNDGSATPYSAGLTLTDEQKAAAIAVIFYKGIECSNNSYERILGLGLKLNNQKQTVWCTGNASSKDIRTIACHSQGTEWNFFNNPDRDGSDNLEQLGAWLEANGSSDDTNVSSKYPAFYWAKDYASKDGTHIITNSIYTTQWYLPSSIEMYKVLLCSDIINPVLTLCGFDELNNTDLYYWTSSQIANQTDRAGQIYKSGTKYGLNNQSKSYEGRVCAIREF